MLQYMIKVNLPFEVQVVAERTVALFSIEAVGRAYIGTTN